MRIVCFGGRYQNQSHQRRLQDGTGIADIFSRVSNKSQLALVIQLQKLLSLLYRSSEYEDLFLLFQLEFLSMAHKPLRTRLQLLNNPKGDGKLNPEVALYVIINQLVDVEKSILHQYTFIMCDPQVWEFRIQFNQHVVNAGVTDSVKIIVIVVVTMAIIDLIVRVSEIDDEWGAWRLLQGRGLFHLHCGWEGSGPVGWGVYWTVKVRTNLCG